MINRGLSFFFALGLASQAASGQTLEMTKIVVRYSGPAIKPDSFFAQPKTVYLVGEKYTRIEEAADPAHKSQTLIITKEPDSWNVNLANKTAQHIVDPGPTFTARIPILWRPKPKGQPDPDQQLERFEFGNETRFFRQAAARDLGMRDVDGKQCKGYSVKIGAREIILLLDSQTDKPARIDITKDGKPEFSLNYISYETNLRFDPSLFELPPGLTVADAKPVPQQSASPFATPKPAATP